MFDLFPDIRRFAEFARLDALGRPAADGRGRARPDGQAAPAAARRALARPRPRHRAGGVRDHRRDPQARHDGIARRAERAYGAQGRQLGLCAGDRPARARRRSRDALERRTHPRRLSRRRDKPRLRHDGSYSGERSDRFLRRDFRALGKQRRGGAPRRRLAGRFQPDRPRQPRRHPRAALCRLGDLRRHHAQPERRAARRHARHRGRRRPLRLRPDGRAAGGRHRHREGQGDRASPRSRCAMPAMSAASANGRSARRRAGTDLDPFRHRRGLGHGRAVRRRWSGGSRRRRSASAFRARARRPSCSTSRPRWSPRARSPSPAEAARNCRRAR